MKLELYLVKYSHCFSDLSFVVVISSVLNSFVRSCFAFFMIASLESLEWHHNERDGVAIHRHLDCLPNRLFRRRSKKISNSASLAFVNSPVTGEFPAQRASSSHFFPFDDVIMYSCYWCIWTEVHEFNVRHLTCIVLHKLGDFDIYRL